MHKSRSSHTNMNSSFGTQMGWCKRMETTQLARAFSSTCKESSKHGSETLGLIQATFFF